MNAANKKEEPKNSEILEAIQVFAQDTQEHFDKIENRLDSVETRLTSVETRLTSVESNMATKDYVDRRAAVTDGKISSLINVLQRKRVITENEKRLILA